MTQGLQRNGLSSSAQSLAVQMKQRTQGLCLGIGVLLTGLPIELAAAHEQWADGTRIPAWVRTSCCGVADVHRLGMAQAKHIDEEGGWFVEGHHYIVPDYQVLPSQDEFVWIFYTTYADGVQSHSYCFFIPQGSM
jgi:hypothetical protein